MASTSSSRIAWRRRAAYSYPVRWPIPLLLVLLVGCSDPSVLLAVQLRSDFAPGDELFEARTTFFTGDRTRRLDEQRHVVSRDTDLASGASVAQLEVMPGPYTVEVDAYGPDGTLIARRRLLVNVDAARVLTVVLTRDCRDVSCPRTGDAANATECYGGRCVPPECVGAMASSSCVMECTTNADCVPTAACAMGQCTDGLCLFPARPEACPTGERCDPDVGCVPEETLPDAGVGMDGGAGVDAGGGDAGGSGACAVDGEACNDGLFCNGADTCMGGTCAQHAGSPCGALCDEGADRCAECATAADCPGPSNGSWSGCGGFGGTCGQDGTQSRDVTTYACTSGSCQPSTSQESRGCSRNTDGTSCGSDEVGTWGPCSGSGTCATSGNQSRTVTSYACAGGSCSGSGSMESQSCTLSPAGDPCDDGDPCTDPDMCTSGGACRGVPECRGSACSGSCPIPVCTGACLDYCDCI
jgi:hypothetical protein